MATINVQANVKTNSGYDIINLNNSGRNTDSSVGYGSSAEGNSTSASVHYSHAEGNNTTASGVGAHAEGNRTSASGDYSHAEGSSTTASGHYSHAEGSSTIARGDYSHAEGYRTTALVNQHAQGHFNNTTLAIANSVSGTSNGTAFVIGNGTGEDTSNAFRVTGEGVTYSKGAYNTTGADYAEYFEWKDENPNSEERYGYFVTLDGDKIVKAKENDYILGIVSKYPSIIGNSDEHWRGQYEMDDFGAYILETKEETYKEIEYDEEMNPQEVEKTREITFYKVNKDYDPNFEYIPRAKRKEWNAIGMLGVLSVYDDGTCEVNGYCKCNDDGIATKCERGFDSYRVIERVTSNIVKVILR